MKSNKEVIFKAEQSGKSSVEELVKVIYSPAISAFVKGILAGIIISLGATAYISLNKEIFSPFIFALSFVAVFAFGYYIFSHRAANLPKQNKLQNLLLFPVWLGNLLGAILVALLLKATRFYESLGRNSLAIITDNLGDSTGSIFLLALFAGMLIFIAGEAFKSFKSSGAKYLTVIFAAMALMYCKFELSLVNAFYYTLTDSWDFAVIWKYLVALAGNTAGALVFPFFGMIISYQKKSSDK